MSDRFANIEDLTPEQVRELAEAYIDLLGKMLDALDECTMGYGFFSSSGVGLNVTGHPPAALVRAILEAS